MKHSNRNEYNKFVAPKWKKSLNNTFKINNYSEFIAISFDLSTSQIQIEDDIGKE